VDAGRRWTGQDFGTILTKFDCIESKRMERLFTIFPFAGGINDIVTEALKLTDVDVACSAHSPSYLEHRLRTVLKNADVHKPISVSQLTLDQVLQVSTVNQQSTSSQRRTHARTHAHTHTHTHIHTHTHTHTNTSNTHAHTHTHTHTHIHTHTHTLSAVLDALGGKCAPPGVKEAEGK